MEFVKDLHVESYVEIHVKNPVDLYYFRTMKNIGRWKSS